MPCPVQLAFHKFCPNDPEAWTLFSPIVPIKQLWAHCTRVFVYMCPRRKESSFTHFYILGALAQGFINDWMKRQGEEEGEIVWIQKANEHTGTPSPGKVMLVFGNLGKRRPREEICRKILKRRAVSESGQCAGQHSMWGCTCVCVCMWVEAGSPGEERDFLSGSYKGHEIFSPTIVGNSGMGIVKVKDTDRQEGSSGRVAASLRGGQQGWGVQCGEMGGQKVYQTDCRFPSTLSDWFICSLL